VSDGAFSYSGTELEALVQAGNYYRWIMSHFHPHIGPRIIEIGAGIGTFSELLLAQPAVDHLIAVEPAKNLFPQLEQRLSGNPRVTLVHGYLDDVPTSVSADSAILVNVLEHVADVASFLAALHARLTSDGRLLILVPAGPRLYGTLDEAFGHYRRYTKPGLSRALVDGDFRLRVLRYFNVAGVLTWFVAGRILRRRTLRAQDVALYDRLVVPWISRLEARWAPPWGQSLIAVAERVPSRKVASR
jgi:SAM-dependent methyltransferase